MPNIFNSRLQNYTVFYYTKDEFHHLKREIFTHDSYYFESENPEPFIIDAGAHIGLATLYFKQLFPAAKITAIEPNPASFKLLGKNVFENQLNNVTLINAALSNESGTETLYLDKSPNQWWSTAGFIEGAWSGDQASKSLEIPTVSLNEIIQEPVEMLKMDIEGAEQRTLLAAEETMPLIKNIFLEFHPHPSQDKRKLIEMLDKYFHLSFYKDNKEVKPTVVRGLFQIEGVRKD